jgi:imidazolonepropionase-like amidohydrolase
VACSTKARRGENPQLTLEEIKALVTTARDYGFTVAAHAHGKEAIRRAVLGGVDSIEHGTFLDEETMRLMKEHGTWYVPTISAGAYVAEKAKVPGFYPAGGPQGARRWSSDAGDGRSRLSRRGTHRLWHRRRRLPPWPKWP